MKVIFGSVAAFGVAALTSASLLAADGVVIAQRITSNGQTTTTQTQITRDKMRVEMAGSGAISQIVIFDGTRSVMNIVDMQRRTYMELTKAQIDQMAQQMQGMMEQMMAGMSPQQRAQMEGMMRGRMGGGMAGMGAPAAKPEFRKVGTDRVAQWTCDKYEGTANGQKVTEVCTIEPTALGLTAADMNVMRQLGDMFKGLAQFAQQAASVMNIGRIEDQGYTGLPIRHVNVTSGTTTEMTGLTRQDIPDAQFQIPAGFTKQDMPMMGGRGRM
jgi:phage terminase Nu1 subunit (DNA packaging protein)